MQQSSSSLGDDPCDYPKRGKNRMCLGKSRQYYTGQLDSFVAPLLSCIVLQIALRNPYRWHSIALLLHFTLLRE
ncbi:MAG: hypothetical protein ACO2ZM_00550 [Francisellaceae bacterium]